MKHLRFFPHLLRCRQFYSLSMTISNIMVILQRMKTPFEVIDQTPHAQKALAWPLTPWLRTKISLIILPLLSLSFLPQCQADETDVLLNLTNKEWLKRQGRDFGYDFPEPWIKERTNKLLHFCSPVSPTIIDIWACLLSTAYGGRSEFWSHMIWPCPLSSCLLPVCG